MEGSEFRQPGAILFNRYQIVRMLGQGGRGEVYLCYDTKLHNSPVALKLLPFDNLWDENAILDMQTEFLSAKKLSHKNIVRLNHFDISEAGAVIEMEFIEGISMHERIYTMGKLGEREVKHVIMQLCDALEYAHAEGVIHRDIKPANVLLAADQNNMTALQNLRHHPKYVRPDQYSVKLVDFGISRGVAALDRLNNNRCFSGTLQYMSPEHCMGEKTDARSDLYSVGCMMYEAVTGGPIFTGDDVGEKQVNQEPTPPRKVNNAQISREFETVILKALAKNPKLRFQSAKEMKEAIEANQALVLGTYHTEFEKSVRKIKKRGAGPQGEGRNVGGDRVCAEIIDQNCGHFDGVGHFGRFGVWLILLVCGSARGKSPGSL
ncbi:serine/threonine-protein kinase [Oscillatoria amoena NRMC-F 0135]|nr:serine/threonine-protein kinase [Oscillatoria amoena NRMC-F 0135]